MLSRKPRSWVAGLFLLCVIGWRAGAQVVKLFHPEPPLISYEVATIKPADPDKPFAGTALRQYIASAYGAPMPWGVPNTHYEGMQVLGGPEWVDKDKYDIKAKAPDELREAMRTMPDAERFAKTRTMQQALLADRFHLKVHFEMREMSIFEIVPAKSGLKITPVDPPPSDGDGSKPPKPGEFRPGTVSLQVGNNGMNILNGRSMTFEMFLKAIRGQAPEIGGRPVINNTGFDGNFDLNDFRFVGLAYTQGAAGASATDPDAPSLQQALEQQLGLKLVPAKGQVEVVVIDSIDRPTDN